MPDRLGRFERIARDVASVAEAEQPREISAHPFETRNIHPALPSIVKKLFDDGHYAQATFEAFKFIDKEVARLSSNSESGFKLMMAVFSDSSPLLKLNACASTSEKDEQKGFQFLFAGSMLAIRNPRGPRVRREGLPRRMPRSPRSSFIVSSPSSTCRLQHSEEVNRRDLERYRV